MPEEILIARLTYAILLIITSLSASIFLFFSPVRRDELKRRSMTWFMRFFLFLSLAFVFYLLQGLLPYKMVLIFNNPVYILGLHCFRYGLLSRRGDRANPFKDPIFLGHIAFVQIVIFVFLLEADLYRLRTIFIMLNFVVVLLGSFPLMIRDRLGRMSENGREVLIPARFSRGERQFQQVTAFIIFMLLAASVMNILINNDFAALSVVLVLQTLSYFLMFGAILSLFLSDSIDLHYHEAIYDTLTGLYKRGFFLEQGERNRMLGERHSIPFCIVAADIDDLGIINQKHGRDGGSRVLQSFSELLKTAIRQTDLYGRLGDGTFGIMLFDCSLDEAERFAGRLKDATELLRIRLGIQEISFSASFGVARVEGTGDFNDSIRLAETALRSAKRNGKNRVAVNTL